MLCVFYTFHPICVKFGRYSKKKLLTDCEFRENWRSESHNVNTKYNYQSKHNKNYCIIFYNMFYNMLYNYMFRPFSLGHLQVVYTRP